MSTPHPGPATLLGRVVASDPGRPRITVYDDTDSPTRGERIELSARVLANWVAKAANLLQDDLDVAPGSVVQLDLPPHWRTLYWALAVWSVGGCVEVPSHRGVGGSAGTDAGARRVASDPVARQVDPDAGRGLAPSPPAPAPRPEVPGPDVLVTDDPAAAAGTEPAVLVTLAALARSAATAVPPGIVDEAREIANHGDLFEAWEEPDDDAPALRAGGADTAYADVVPDGSGERVHTATPDTAAFLRLALRALAGDGSVVLTRGEPDPDVLEARLTAEGVTATA